MKLCLGYRRLTLNDVKVSAHEFHYSNFIEKGSFTTGIEVVSARGTAVDMPVLRHHKIWASYAHLYLGEAHKMKAFLTYLGVL